MMEQHPADYAAATMRHRHRQIFPTEGNDQVYFAPCLRSCLLLLSKGQAKPLIDPPSAGRLPMPMCAWMAAAMSARLPRYGNAGLRPPVIVFAGR